MKDGRRIEWKEFPICIKQGKKCPSLFHFPPAREWNSKGQSLPQCTQALFLLFNFWFKYNLDNYNGKIEKIMTKTSNLFYFNDTDFLLFCQITLKKKVNCHKHFFLVNCVSLMLTWMNLIIQNYSNETLFNRACPKLMWDTRPSTIKFLLYPFYGLMIPKNVTKIHVKGEISDWDLDQEKIRLSLKTQVKNSASSGRFKGNEAPHNWLQHVFLV